MIKFEIQLAINNNPNDKSNTASYMYNKKLDQLYVYLHPYNYTLLIWKKVTKIVRGCVVCNLTTKRMPTFSVVDSYNKQMRESTNF